MATKKKTENTSPGAGSLILVCGNDEFVVSTRTRELVQQLCPETEQALGLEIIDGAVDKTDDAVEAIKQGLEALLTLGLFGGNKLVWMKDVSFLSDNAVGRIKATKDEVKAFTENLKKGLPAGHCLILNAPKVDKRSSLYKLFKDKGTLHEFNVAEKSFQAEKDARGRAQDLFKEGGYTLSDQIHPGISTGARYGICQKCTTPEP